MFKLHHSFSRTERLTLAKAMLQRLESEESNAKLEYLTEMQLQNRLVSKVSTAQLLALASCKITCRTYMICKDINCDQELRHYKSLEYACALKFKSKIISHLTVPNRYTAEDIPCNS